MWWGDDLQHHFGAETLEGGDVMSIGGGNCIFGNADRAEDSHLQTSKYRLGSIGRE